MAGWKPSTATNGADSPLLNEEEQKLPPSGPGFGTEQDTTSWRKIMTAIIAILTINVLTLTYLLSPRALCAAANATAIEKQADTITVPKTLTCGNTSDEAIALGCVMEPLLYGWVNPECYYADLSSQYNVFEDRSWYLDSSFNNSLRATVEGMWKGQYPYIHARKIHTEHCLFQARKIARAVNRREKWLDTKTLALEHTDHCSQELLAEWEDDFGDTEIRLGFYPCRWLPWDVTAAAYVEGSKAYA